MPRLQWETPLDRIRATEREDERADALRRLRAVEQEQQPREPIPSLGPNRPPLIMGTGLPVPVEESGGGGFFDILGDILGGVTGQEAILAGITGGPKEGEFEERS
ncbi:hypothetical protein LCGC14_2965670, partial [marine sediment metagenome]